MRTYIFLILMTIFYSNILFGQEAITAIDPVLNSIGLSTGAKQDVGNGYLLDIKGLVDGLEGGQSTGNGYLNSIDTKLTSQATAAKQDTGNSSLSSIDGKMTGAATSAKQDTGNTSAASIDGKTPSLPRSTSGSIVFGGNQTVEIDLTSSGGRVESVGVVATGTFTGDIAIEGTINGTDWDLIDGVVPATSAAVSFTSSYLNTTNRSMVVSAAGFKKIRLNGASVLASGTADVTLNATASSVSYYSIPSTSTEILDRHENEPFTDLTGAGQLVGTDCSGRSMVEFDISGTWVGSINLYADYSSGLTTVKAYPLVAGVLGTPTTSLSNGRYEIPCGGLGAIYASMDAYTSGSAHVETNASTGNRIILADVFSLPATAATSTLQTTGNTSLSGILTSAQLLDDVVGTNGSAVVSKSYLMGGTDGTNQRAIKLDSSGNVVISNSFALDSTLTALSAKFSSLGQKAMASSAPVVISSDQTAIPVTDNGGSLTVDFTQPALVAGSAIIGKIGIDQTTPGTTNKVSIGTDGTVAINAALPSGSALIGKVGIDQTTPGTTNAVSLSHLGSTAVATGNGVVGAGVQRVAIASDNTAFSVNIGTSGSLALDATLTGGTQKTKITDGTNDATVKAASTAAVATDKAVVVAISPNNTVAATESGTWTVQPGNTPNTTPWLTTINDGTNAAKVTAASTAAVAADKALVVSQNPNGGNPCQNPSATLVSATGATSGTAAVQIVALSGSTKIYLCSLSVIGVSGTNPTFSLVQGTGSNCATGQTVVVQSWTTTAGAIYAFAPMVAVGVAGNALCYLDTGTTPIQRYTMSYVQQ